MPRYDRIGQGYTRTRREDPRFRALIHAALADARTVVNVGAGAGAYDPVVSASMWLMAEYLREVAELDLRIFPPPQQLAKWLGGDVRIDQVPIPRDTPDWMLGSFWAYPERVLDADARAATSGFARMPVEVVDRVVAEVSRDLMSGRWDARHGHLRRLDALDAGLRLVVATPG